MDKVVNLRHQSNDLQFVGEFLQFFTFCRESLNVEFHLNSLGSVNLAI